MKKFEISARRAKSIVPMGAVKTQTKGAAHFDQDGSQGQTRDNMGLSND